MALVEKEVAEVEGRRRFRIGRAEMLEMLAVPGLLAVLGSLVLLVRLAKLEILVRLVKQAHDRPRCQCVQSQLVTWS